MMKTFKSYLKQAMVIGLLFTVTNLMGQDLLKVLLIDGQNVNHAHWEEVTKILQDQLKDNQRFSLEVVTTAEKGGDLSGFSPDFQAYDVVVSYYDGDEWPEATKNNFVKYVENGGGLVIVHAANNAFPKWKEYNEMIGLGGWGNRDENSGPYVYYSENMEKVVDYSPGRGGHHGKAHEYIVETIKEHPITDGLPEKWLHAKDELYEQLRGPAKNMTVLAVAFADEKYGGSSRYEPILMTLSYGKGKIFHTVLGHDATSVSCVGFKTTFLRGTEWAATGEVTIPVPDSFPTAEAVSVGK